MKRFALTLTLVLLPAAVFADDDHVDYVDACFTALGDIPAFSCADGTPVPVTRNGQEVTFDNFKPGITCDRPGLLPNDNGDVGQCIPYSRILDLSTKDTSVAVMCRQKKIRPADSLLFDEIDVIAHDPKTGATCWWAAKTEDKSPVDGSAVPAPTDAKAAFPWIPPEGLVSEGCGNCHDNDPFMYSPFVGQVWAIIPENPFGPYYHVDTNKNWFADWPTEVMNPRDSTCTGCHRIGLRDTCGDLTDWMTGTAPDGADDLARQFPLSHGMPPDHGMTQEQWTTIYGPGIATIKSCCEDPDQPVCGKSPLLAFPKTQE